MSMSWFQNKFTIDFDVQYNENKSEIVFKQSIDHVRWKFYPINDETL